MSEQPKEHPVTHAYRAEVARSAALGGAISPMAEMVFGSSDRPYDSAADTEVPGEVARVPVVCTPNGAGVTCVGVLTGALAGSAVIRGAGVVTGAGTLVGRAVLAPKSFEPSSELEVTLNFEY